MWLKRSVLDLNGRTVREHDLNSAQLTAEPTADVSVASATVA